MNSITQPTPSSKNKSMKPKQNRKGQKSKSATFDRCQTPHYALDPLLPYLPKDSLIWEAACGEGQIVDKLTQEGFGVIGTDLLTGFNFFTWQPEKWDIQVTNPPYSIKYDWLRWSYQFNKPFALLLPLETLGAGQAQELFEEFGIEIILPRKRINFKMPNKGYGKSGAQFPTCWFTWGLGIGRQLTFAPIGYYADSQAFLFSRVIPEPDSESQLWLFEALQEAA